MEPTRERWYRRRIAELERELEKKAMAMKPPAVPVMQELPEKKRRSATSPRGVWSHLSATARLTVPT